MTQWPPRRQPRRRHRFIVPTLFVVALAVMSWSLLTQLRDEPLSDELTAEDRGQLSTELYGVRSLKPRIDQVLVDRPDSLGPIALVVAGPGTAAADWSALQALFERQGLASVLVAPQSSEWSSSIQRAGEDVQERSRRQGRPVVVVTVGSGLDSLLKVFPPGHALRTNRLAAISPESALEGGWRGLWRRLRPGAARSDQRLAAWSGAALIVRSVDGEAFDSAAAARLAAGPNGSVEVLSGGGFEQAPRHPVDYEWRRVIRFLTATAEAADFVMGSDPADTVTSPTSVTPAETVDFNRVGP